MKTCSVCFQDKSLSEFYKGRKQCKPCLAAKKAAWYSKDPESRRKKHKEWRDNSEEHLKSKRKKEWATLKSNPKALKEHNKRQRSAWRTYAKSDKGKLSHKRAVHNRRARLAGATGFHDFEECLKIYNYCCAWCGTKENLSLDHIIPLTKGGSNWQFNIQPLCVSCNSSKNNKVKDVYQQYFSIKK